MAETKITWIKLSTDFNDNPKIRLLKRTYKNGRVLALIWIELLVLAGRKNDSGVICATNSSKMTLVEELSLILDEKREHISAAVDAFIDLNMIEVSEEGLFIKNWGKYQELEIFDEIKKSSRERVRRYRERQKELSRENGKNL